MLYISHSNMNNFCAGVNETLEATFVDYSLKLDTYNLFPLVYHEKIFSHACLNFVLSEQRQ